MPPLLTFHQLQASFHKMVQNGWDLFVVEMMGATNMEDAKARASRVLEILEKSIMARATDEEAQSFQKEKTMLKEQIKTVIRENSILKRARKTESRNEEVKHLKQLISQYQERLRTIEINNYALSMHLKQAQLSSSIPERFHPDVF